ncbi:MAG: ATP-binding cassette domain-containing protein [Oscillospiraceae bacterium]|jgi:ABC-2 type transport system ATP-binding protein|nr:ATP-binding cassette domain-containing protein [Oscillospiraceae bacterium]
MLTADGLTKLYKNGRGAREVTFCVEGGEVMGLLGPNGSGKTTVMKACVGLVLPTAGRAAIGGHDVVTRREAALAGVGALIESPALFDRLTARRNLEMAAAYYPELPGGRVDEVLAIVELERYPKDKVLSFSLGMRQRLGVALALLSRPSVLILDEPANGLDIEGMVAIREIVKNAAASGAAVLISSHLAHEIELSATKVGVMHDGMLLKTATMAEVLTVSPSLEDYYLAEVQNYRKGRLSA